MHAEIHMVCITDIHNWHVLDAARHATGPAAAAVCALYHSILQSMYSRLYCIHIGHAQGSATAARSRAGAQAAGGHGTRVCVCVDVCVCVYVHTRAQAAGGHVRHVCVVVCMCVYVYIHLHTMHAYVHMKDDARSEAAPRRDRPETRALGARALSRQNVEFSRQNVERPPVGPRRCWRELCRYPWRRCRDWFPPKRRCRDQ